MSELPQPDASGERKGIYWMIACMFMFVTMDAGAKYLIERYSVVQVVWGRYFFHAVLLGILLAPRLRQLLVTSRLGLQLLRSLLLLVVTAIFFTGLRYVPIADASAIMLISPLVLTALSVPILKERVGPRRWAGVLLGCIGALIIIRPGTAMMQTAALLPLCAAVLYAIYQISTRFLSRTDSVLTTLVYTASLGAAIMSLVVPFHWQPPSLFDWSIMALTGIVGGLGHFCLINAFTVAPAGTVAPFTYTNLIWATLYGYIIFGDVPDGWTIAGAAIVVGSGLYVFHREHRVANAAPGGPSKSPD